MRELAFNKDCSSEHICKYYGAFMDDSSGTISIAMEYCEGGSLDGVYREVRKLGGRTGEKVLGKVADGVLNGLTYLHGRKIIHRGMCGQFLTPIIAHISQTSNPRMYSSLAQARSDSATLA